MDLTVLQPRFAIVRRFTLDVLVFVVPRLRRTVTRFAGNAGNSFGFFRAAKAYRVVAINTPRVRFLYVLELEFKIREDLLRFRVFV